MKLIYHIYIFPQGYLSSSECPARSLSEPTVSGLMNIAQLGHLWATTGNLLGDQKATKAIPKRKVKFQSQVRVVLIPSRSEYVSANLALYLWWEETDYTFFKASAISELKEHMRFKSEKCTTKEAIQILYQPDSNNDEIVNENFNSGSQAFNSLPTVQSKSKITNYHDGAAIVAPIDCNNLGLIDAQTDVDLTGLRRHSKSEDELLIMVHPLAYMCPQ